MTNHEVGRSGISEWQLKHFSTSYRMWKSWNKLAYPNFWLNSLVWSADLVVAAGWDITERQLGRVWMLFCEHLSKPNNTQVLKDLYLSALYRRANLLITIYKIKVIRHGMLQRTDAQRFISKWAVQTLRIRTSSSNPEFTKSIDNVTAIFELRRFSIHAYDYRIKRLHLKRIMMLVSQIFSARWWNCNVVMWLVPFSCFSHFMHGTFCWGNNDY